MKKTDHKSSSLEELKKILKEAEKSLFDFRKDHALRKLKNFKLINLKKKEIAGIKTEIRNKEILKNAG